MVCTNLSTHDLDEALKIGDRIAIMKDGNIVQIGEPEEILNSPADAYVREFIQDVNRTKIVSASSIMRSSESIILEKAGVRTAAKKMKDLEISSIFVTDKHKTLLGIITIDKVSELMKENRDDLKSVIDTDIRTVGVDTSIDEMIPLFLQSGYPVAVVDDENKLKGIIFKSTVLAGIAGKEEVSIDS